MERADSPNTQMLGHGLSGWYQHLTKLRCVDLLFPICNQCIRIQRDPSEHRLRTRKRKLARDDARCRSNHDDRRVGDVYLITIGYVDPDPHVLVGIPARANPRGHRQPRRAGVEVRHLEQVFGFFLHVRADFIHLHRQPAFRVHVAIDRGLPRGRDRDCAAAGVSGVTDSGSSRDALRPRPRPICFASPDRRSE
jgi:hypothetical protein